MTQSPQPSNRQEWFSHVEQQEKSGLNCVEYCRQNDLNKDRFFYYCKLLRTSKIKLEPSPSFTPIMPALQSQGSSTEIRIELPNGFRFLIPQQFDQIQIKQLIGILLSC